jgi:hypothetical protein
MGNLQAAIKLTPEARTLLESLLAERDAAASRVGVALIAMKAALGIPLDWTIRTLDEGFVEPPEQAKDRAE